MSKINIKLMSDETFATLKKNIESYVDNFKNNPIDSSWINTITTEKAFEIKKYQIEDFELLVPKGPQDHETNLKNGIILFEHLNILPSYIISEPKFWLWVMFEKGYEVSLKCMEKIDATAFKHQWLFVDGIRRGLFFGILSRLYYRVELTYSPENTEDSYYLAKYVMENPSRFREITWRTISNHRFVVKAMLKAEIRVNNELEFEEKTSYFGELAKEISKLGSIKLIDAMNEKDIEDYIYDKYYKIINLNLEKQKIEKYNYAIDAMCLENEKGLKKAIKIFGELNDFMDSKKMLEECNEKYKNIKAKKGFFGLFKSK